MYIYMYVYIYIYICIENSSTLDYIHQILTHLRFNEPGHHSSCWAIHMCSPIGLYEVGNRLMTLLTYK